MRLVLAALAAATLFAAPACTTVQSSVRGELLISPMDEASPPTSYVVEVIETHGTTGLLVGCILTGVFYGGACWAYLATPLAADEAIAREHAKDQAKRVGRCADLIITGDVERAGWNNAGPIELRVTNKKGVRLSASEVAKLCTAAPPAPAPAAPSPPAPPS